MVARSYIFIIALILSLGPEQARADAAQDARVEDGVAAYDAGDYQRAKDILLPLAEAGHPKAMNMIGLMHYDTPVFPNDPKIECDWYEKAANVGSPSAMYNMSICYDGYGRPEDPDMDKAWLLRAADQGHIPAMINLAALDPDEGKEYLRWMMMAQNHGSAYAKVSLWLQDYKTESQMTLSDFVCVSWKILILDGEFRDCD